MTDRVDIPAAVIEYVMDHADALSQVGERVKKLLGLNADADVTENVEFWEVFTLLLQQEVVSAAQGLTIKPGDLIVEPGGNLISQRH